MFKLTKRFGMAKIDLKLDSSCAENLLAATFDDIYQLLTTVGYKYDSDSSNNGRNNSVKHVFNISDNHSLEVNISTIKQDGYDGMLRKFKNSISKSAPPNVEVQLSELLFTRMDVNLAARLKFNRDGTISTFYDSLSLAPISNRGRISDNAKLFEIIIPSHWEGSGDKNRGIIPILDHIGAVPVPENYPGVYFIPPSQLSTTSLATTTTTDSIIANDPSTDAVYVRVFPARTMTLIVKVPNLLEIMEKLRSLPLSTPLLLESIGARASYGSIKTTYMYIKTQESITYIYSLT